MNSNLKTGAFWIVLACVLVLGWQVVKSGRSRPEKTIIFTDFIREVEAGKVRKVTISGGTHVEGEYKDNGPALHTLIPERYVAIYKILQDHSVDIEIREDSDRGWVSVLINASPFILLLTFWGFMMRQVPKIGEAVRQERRDP